MQFPESFISLGYSAYVLLFSILFVGGFIFRLLGLHKRGWQAKSAFVILLIVGFVLATNFLAAERKMLMDAIRDDGGLKRTLDR